MENINCIVRVKKDLSYSITTEGDEQEGEITTVHDFCFPEGTHIGLEILERYDNKIWANITNIDSIELSLDEVEIVKEF